MPTQKKPTEPVELTPDAGTPGAAPDGLPPQRALPVVFDTSHQPDFGAGVELFAFTANRNISISTSAGHVQVAKGATLRFPRDVAQRAVNRGWGTATNAPDPEPEPPEAA